MYHIWYTEVSVKKPKEPKKDDRPSAETTARSGKRVPAIFYHTEGGREPVRQWLKALPYPDDRKRIGEDIKTVEFGWLIGMPTCRAMGHGVFEVRTQLTHNRIARVHGFIKKTQKTPNEDLALARRNKQKHERGI